MSPIKIRGTLSQIGSALDGDHMRRVHVDGVYPNHETSLQIDLPPVYAKQLVPAFDVPGAVKLTFDLDAARIDTQDDPGERCRCGALVGDPPVWHDNARLCDECGHRAKAHVPSRGVFDPDYKSPVCRSSWCKVTAMPLVELPDGSHMCGPCLRDVADSFAAGAVELAVLRKLEELARVAVGDRPSAREGWPSLQCLRTGLLRIEAWRSGIQDQDGQDRYAHGRDVGLTVEEALVYGRSAVMPTRITGAT